ncbi:MAG: aminopeptidase [Chloroflexi bacterium]|nr:aminopeptidase [Chloroflexota bacterium]
MELRVVTDQPWDVPADVLALPIVGEPDLAGPLGELDRRCGGELAALAAFGELTGRRYASALAPAGQLPAGRLLAIGAGEADALDRETTVHVGAAMVRRLAGRPVRRLALWLEPLAARLDGGAAAAAELVTRGVVEGGYDPQAPFRVERDAAPPALDELILVAPGAADAADLARAAARGRVIGEGANFARDLANRPANEASPEVLAEEARTVAARHGLFVDVIDERRAADMGMGMFLAVGRGSANPPRLIVLRSGGEGELDAAGRHLALVGKGVCFDSGGISIKPADKMEEMKMDKTGACTVIAAAATVARLAPGTPLLVVAPAVENMPGPHSARPGDVVRALNGRTVDIINTDAEGRLILGDALTYAERLGATHVVDVATLTGAVARAFGHLISGVFGSPQAWYEEVAAAAGRAGERVWQLPLEEDYWPEMESWYADMVNTGGAEAGLIKSALFLRRFVTVPWAHLDIAGTAYFRKATPYATRGATGASHATLVELALAGAR